MSPRQVGLAFNWPGFILLASEEGLGAHVRPVLGSGGAIAGMPLVSPHSSLNRAAIAGHVKRCGRVPAGVILHKCRLGLLCKNLPNGLRRVSAF